jgi:hypothetical protein
MLITGAFDGPLTGGTPKLVEIYVVNDIADLSVYGFGSANNGGGTDGQEIAFAGSATAGDFIYVASEGSNPGSVNTYFGITADYLDSSANVNGDDALELFLNSNVIDTFGDIDTDGSGEPWEYLDGWAYRIDGTGPDGANFVQGNWSYSGANAVDGCTDNGSCSSTFPIGTYSTTASTTPSITITSPADGAVLSPGTTTTDVSYNAMNVPATGAIQVTVNSDPPGTTTDNPVTLFVDNGQPYTIKFDIIDGGMVLATDQITITVASATQVANIAALRAGTEGEFYELTGEAFLNYQQSFRNQKFIEDATGGILIDDTAGNITSTFAIGDGMTGLIGTLGSFGGMMQFAPSQDPGAASSTGNTLTPQAVSLLDLATNAENYESELVMVTGVTMENSTPNFSGASVHGMSQGGDSFDFRSSFFDADYADQGAAVPTVMTDIVGIVNERSGNLYFLTARDAADFSAPILSTNEFDTVQFSLYPNPTNTGSVTISSSNSDEMNVVVFDILGKQVKNEILTNNTLNVSSLKSGIYIVKITQNNASITKKLVIK